jgi:CheY-like chemotaxis protein
VKLRCVILDDDEAFLTAARVLLARDGLAVAGVATSSVEAIECVGALRPDVVLVDIRLGQESGFDAAGGLPGRYQVGWGKGGVYVRGGCSGAGHSNERDGVDGDPVPVALEGNEVVGVELACLQPLD